MLLGDEHWRKTFREILSEIERERPTSTVSVYIYNPARIVYGLGKLFAFGDPSYLPALQIVVADGDETVIYWGALAWNGRAVGITVEEWLVLAYGSVTDFIVKNQYGLLHEQEEVARQMVELGSFVLEVRHAGQENERASLLTVEGGRLSRGSPDSVSGASIAAYVSKNIVFGQSLVTKLASLSIGVVN